MKREQSGKMSEVSDEEFEEIPERISNHFDRVSELLEQELGDSDA